MSSGHDAGSDAPAEGEDAQATSERVTEAIEDSLDALEQGETVSKEELRELLHS